MKSRAPSSVDPRLAAARVLHQVLDGRSLSDCLQPGLACLADGERALAAELAQGACRWYPRLDFILRRLLAKPLRKRDGDVRALLAIGLYQLRHMRIPPHAAVTETVNATRGLGKEWARGLVNGLLRRCERETEQIDAAVASDPVARLSQPDWILQALRRDWPEDWETIAEALCGRPPMTLRVDLARQSRDDYLAGMRQRGLAAQPVAGISSAVQLTAPAAVGDLPGFDTGLVSVQDAGAQLAAPWLDPQPGQAVLDVCAAPGGKSLHLLQHCPDIRLTAVDISAQRMARVEENLARAGVHAECCVGDATDPTPPWGGRQYDRILVDAPCSATGVMRRHPDIRLLRRAADIAQLAERQLGILRAVWPLLRPGGKLLYVTCSVLSQENESRVETFMSSEKTAIHLELPATTGIGRGPGRQLPPGNLDADGFYYALLGRRP